jgi:hypothetical protein
MTAWDVLEVVANIFDLLAHWRFYVCFLSGLVAAIWIYTSIHDATLVHPLAVAALISGAGVGPLWERRS